jgi:hypothetical protein
VGNNGQYCVVDFNSAGDATVNVTVTIDSTGCTNESSYSVTVGSGNAPQPFVAYSFGEFVCLENIEDNVTSYQWGYDSKATLDSTILTGQINQVYANSNPDTLNNYYWVITEANGCFNKAYYNAQSLTGVTNTKAAVTDVKIYPNPTSNFINVEINSTLTGNINVELTDMLGQKIDALPAVNNKAVIDVSKLAAGVYIIDCYQGGVKISAAKFTKN